MAGRGAAGTGTAGSQGAAAAGISAGGIAGDGSPMVGFTDHSLVTSRKNMDITSELIIHHLRVSRNGAAPKWIKMDDL